MARKDRYRLPMMPREEWTSPALTDQALPVVEAIPNLSGFCGRKLTRSLLRELTFTMFGAPSRGIPPGRVSHVHYKLIVRLADKAAAEYEAARTELIAYVNRSQNSPEETLHITAAVDHFENLFNALARALTLLDLLKRDSSVPVTNDDLRPFETEIVRKIRNAIEHVDDFLRTGEISMDDDTMIRPWCEGVEFVRIRVRYSELARWIMRVYAIAERLLDHDPRTLLPVVSGTESLG
jgi:hypothetical protein